MTQPIDIRVDRTPNPEAVKFTTNRLLRSGPPLTISEPLQAFALPLAAALLAIPGVRSLFFLREFVTVTREAGADWDALIPAIETAIRAHAAD